MSEVGIRPTGTQLAESLVPNPHLTFAAAFAALDDAGIVWCLLRGEADLDRPDQEVDLMVDEVDAARLAEVLGARGFAELAAWGRGSHRPFVGYDSTDDAWPKLDVVTRIDFGRLAEIETGAAAECLARRTRVGDVAMLAEGDRFWALLLHCILDRGDVPERHAEPLRRMAHLAGTRLLAGPLAAWFEANAPSGWDAPRVIELARQGLWASLVALGREVREAGAPPGRRGARQLSAPRCAG